MGKTDEYDEDLTTEAGMRKLRAKYLGLVSLVDNAVGEILQALDETGLTDNTIVVYTSEHGDMMGDHGLLRKCVNYEEALKVPLIVRVPWLDGNGQKIEGRISQIDLVPTLLDLLGEPIPPHLEGTSRASILRGEGTLADNEVFVQWNGTNGWEKAARALGLSESEWADVYGPWRTVISAEGWKLNLSPVDQCELYDLNTDPFEQVNLFDEPSQRDRILDLTERLQQWQEYTADEAPLLPATPSATRG
jgi:arylsulfatase A-like enzyme